MKQRLTREEEREREKRRFDGTLQNQKVKQKYRMKNERKSTVQNLAKKKTRHATKTIIILNVT